MRTIKFRVWDNKEKIWIHGPNSRPELDGCNILGEAILLGGFVQVSIERLNDLVVLQYTGVDVDAKPLYEGDIVEIVEYSLFDCDAKISFRGWIYYDTSNAAFLVMNKKGQSSSFTGQEIKVRLLGNMFDNPELLEQCADVEKVSETTKYTQVEAEEIGLVKCENCGEFAWDGRICHTCGAKRFEMKSLIRFTQPANYIYRGRTVYVNPDEIVSVEPYENGTAIIAMRDKRSYVVDESPASAVEKINLALS